MSEETRYNEFTWARSDLNVSFLNAAGIAGIIGVLFLLYKKVKPLIQSVIDKWQDKVQRYVATKWGEEVASEVRDIMEGAEEFLLGIAERLAKEKQAAKVAMKVRYKDEVTRAMKLPVNDKIKAADVQALVDQMANDPDKAGITPEIAEEVRELVRKMENEK